MSSEREKRHSKRFGDDETELFIEKVRAHVYLYDFEHNDYKDTQKKNKAWNTIAHEMNISSQVAKKKWKSLRDNYLRHIRCLKEGTKGGPRAASYQKWPWGHQMRFLDPSIQNKLSIQKNGYLYDGTTELEELEIETGDTIPSTTDPLLASPSQPETEDEDHEFHSSWKRKKIEVVVDQDPFTTMSGDKAFPYIQNTPETDGIDHLFLSYAHTFRKFQPATQALMKVELATLFAKTEMKVSVSVSVSVFSESLTSNAG